MKKTLMESLEVRQMLSVTSENGVLRIDGTAGNDSILLTGAQDQVEVVVNGVSQTFNLFGLERARVRAGKGNDVIDIKIGLAANVSGGPGNDKLIGYFPGERLDGGSGNDLIDGNTGDDTLIGGAGRDTLKGKAGNDSLVGDNGNDQLDGGRGNDLLNGASGSDKLSGGAGSDLTIDPVDRLIDPDTADQDLNSFFGAFPGIFNDLFPNGNPGNGGGIFGNGGGSIFGGGGSIFD